MANLIPLYLYQGHPLPSPQHLYDYVLAAQGLIKRSDNSHTSADLLLHRLPPALTLTGLNLQAYPLRGVQLKRPRIPGAILQELLADARQDLDREFMYLVRFDPASGRYVIDRPAQQASAVHVGYAASAGSNVLLEIHSHNRMAAFFSPTDDRDEQGGRYYAVMGRLDQARPQLALRVGMYGHWAFNVPSELLFEQIEPFDDVWAEPAAPRSNPFPEPEGAAPDPSWLAKLIPWRRYR